MLSSQLTLYLAATAGVLIMATVFTASLIVGRNRRLARTEHLKQRWQRIQRGCGKSEQWPMCIVEADKVLDEALKSAGFKGKSTGERLVAAQRRLTDNDGVWFGHKLRNKIVHEEINRLYKRDVQTALMGIRQALQDLGVL